MSRYRNTTTLAHWSMAEIAVLSNDVRVMAVMAVGLKAYSREVRTYAERDQVRWVQACLRAQMRTQEAQEGQSCHASAYSGSRGYRVEHSEVGTVGCPNSYASLASTLRWLAAVWATAGASAEETAEETELATVVAIDAGAEVLDHLRAVERSCAARDRSGQSLAYETNGDGRETPLAPTLEGRCDQGTSPGEETVGHGARWVQDTPEAPVEPQGL